MKKSFDGQLAKSIYLSQMSAMKEILKLGEFKIGSRESEEYKYFKKVVMDEIYNSMTDVFSGLENENILEKCPCGTSIRLGYKKDCVFCNGASYRNTETFNDFLTEQKVQRPEA